MANATTPGYAPVCKSSINLQLYFQNVMTNITALKGSYVMTNITALKGSY